MPDDQRTIDGVEDEDLDDLGGGLDDGLGGTDDVDVEVGADPAAQYDHLVDGTPGDTAQSEEDGGGLLSGLFGSDEEETAAEPADDATAAEGGFLANRIGGTVSLRGFAVVFLLTTALVGIAATFVPIVEVLVGVPLGLFVAAFLGGLLSGTRRYAEFGITGTIIGLAAVLLGDFDLAIFVGTGIPPLVGGGALGLVIGLATTIVGHYFGRDLRLGLTKDIGD